MPFPAEITFVRGIPLLRPDGTKFLIRARFSKEFPDDQLPFQAQVTVRGRAKKIEPAPGGEVGVTPPHGPPIRLTGTIARVGDLHFVVECPFPVEISGAPPGVGALVSIDLEDGLEVLL
jgi:hypothetical protein